MTFSRKSASDLIATAIDFSKRESGRLGKTVTNFLNKKEKAQKSSWEFVGPDLRKTVCSKTNQFPVMTKSLARQSQRGSISTQELLTSSMNS
jgi:hypothetical protein